jgi:hypothetical protein
MSGKYPPPEVTIRCYPDTAVCDVVVVVRGREMVLRCRDYRQALQYARVERKSYHVSEPTSELADPKQGETDVP